MMEASGLPSDLFLILPVFSRLSHFKYAWDCELQEVLCGALEVEAGHDNHIFLLFLCNRFIEL